MVYFDNDVGRDKAGTIQKGNRGRHVRLLVDDVGDALDGEFDDIESDSDSETKGEVGV